MKNKFTAGCLLCEKNHGSKGKRKCPECSHEFKGKGWEGIDAHWRAKHEKRRRCRMRNLGILFAQNTNFVIDNFNSPDNINPQKFTAQNMATKTMEVYRKVIKARENE